MALLMVRKELWAIIHSLPPAEQLQVKVIIDGLARTNGFTGWAVEPNPGLQANLITIEESELKEES